MTKEANHFETQFRELALAKLGPLIDEHDFVEYRSIYDGENFGNAALYLASGAFRLRISQDRGFWELAVGPQLSDITWFYVGRLAAMRKWAGDRTTPEQQVKLLIAHSDELADILKGPGSADFAAEYAAFVEAQKRYRD